MKDVKYWMNDLKKTEKAIYLGHISAEDKMYGFDEDILKKLNRLKEGNDMEGLRFSSLRDLCDSYPSYSGHYYGVDMWIIVKNGKFKKNQEFINKCKEALIIE